VPTAILTFAEVAFLMVARIQQDWFADLRRGTGAAVISSASGNEYALEASNGTTASSPTQY
jgi:hypothetical protein